MTKLILYVDIYNHIYTHELYFGICGQTTALQSDSDTCSRFALASAQCSSSVERLFMLRRAAKKITCALPTWNVHTNNATHSNTTLHPPFVLCVEWQNNSYAHGSRIRALVSDPRYIALCAARDALWNARDAFATLDTSALDTAIKNFAHASLVLLRIYFSETFDRVTNAFLEAKREYALLQETETCLQVCLRRHGVPRVDRVGYIFAQTESNVQDVQNVPLLEWVNRRCVNQTEHEQHEHKRYCYSRSGLASSIQVTKTNVD